MARSGSQKPTFGGRGTPGRAIGRPLRFWDSSAVLPLVLHEPFTVEAVAMLEQDPEALVWWGTQLECWSGIQRRIRDGSLYSAELDRVAQQLQDFVDLAIQVEPGAQVRDRALGLLTNHPLRAADALQLAAALVGMDSLGPSLEFVCLDHRLREAAAREGFLLGPRELPY